MAVETGQAGETTDEARADPDRNDVTVEFADGTWAAYAVVVRPPGGDWLHAERLVGDGDGLDDEEFEAINPDAVQRIRSDCVHFSDGGAVHFGEGLFVDPEALLAECGLA